MAPSNILAKSAFGQLIVDLQEQLSAQRTKFRARWDLYMAYRRSVRELDALSDRELADLGMFRCDIDAIARKAVYGDA